MAGLLDMGVSFESIIRTPENVSRKVFVSTDWRIVYVNHGTADWRINDQHYKVKPGTIIFLHNKYQRIISKIHSDYFDIWVINMKPQFVFNFGFTELFESVLDKYSPVFNNCPVEVASLFENMHGENKIKKSNYMIMIYSATLMILTHLNRERGFVSEPGVFKPKVQKVLDFIDDNFCRQIYLSQLSEMACMTKEAFSKYFKRITGINVFRYICHKRIARAIELIDTTDLTILDIALQCGFENMANFYKTFRTLTGQIPSALRPKQKNIYNSQKS